MTFNILNNSDEPHAPQQQRRRGMVQMALLRDLMEREYEPWHAYYINPERLIPVLTKDKRRPDS